jgi:hypothetical protein
LNPNKIMKGPTTTLEIFQIKKFSDLFKVHGVIVKM